MRRLFPLALLLAGCGPQLDGNWNILTWAVSGDSVEDEVGDVGFLILSDPAVNPTGLTRYYWTGEDFAPFSEPVLFTHSGEIGQAGDEEWSLTTELGAEFWLERYNGTRLILVAEDWPAGLTSTWTLER